MEEKTYPVLQEIINRAYDDHNKPEYTKEQFWSRLDYSERIAVHCVNLYNQVCNGGFAQWHDNGYSAASQDLLLCLKDIGQTDVANLVIFALKRIAEYEDEQRDSRNWWGDADDIESPDFDDIDTAFYNGLDEGLLDAVEAYLTALRG